MDYSLKNIEKLLRETDEYLERLKQEQHNKKVGYSPKCKVCNSEWLDEIEELREDGFTLKEIQEELSLHDISIMSLSRHFKNHYPKSQKYKEEQQLEMLENIKEAYLQYPFLEDYFKDRDLEYLETFNSVQGFCTDKFGLCNLIEPSTVSNGINNVYRLHQRQEESIDELRKSRYGFLSNKEEITDIKISYMDNINFCLNCKNRLQEERLTLLERIITYNFLNIVPENKELYFNLLQFNGSKEEFIQTLTEVKEETQDE